MNEITATTYVNLHDLTTNRKESGTVSASSSYGGANATAVTSDSGSLNTSANDSNPAAQVHTAATTASTLRFGVIGSDPSDTVLNWNISYGGSLQTHTSIPINSATSIAFARLSTSASVSSLMQGDHRSLSLPIEARSCYRLRSRV